MICKCSGIFHFGIKASGQYLNKTLVLNSNRICWKLHFSNYANPSKKNSPLSLKFQTDLSQNCRDNDWRIALQKLSKNFNYYLEKYFPSRKMTFLNYWCLTFKTKILSRPGSWANLGSYSALFIFSLKCLEVPLTTRLLTPSAPFFKVRS